MYNFVFLQCFQFGVVNSLNLIAPIDLDLTQGYCCLHVDMVSCLSRCPLVLVISFCLCSGTIITWWEKVCWWQLLPHCFQLFELLFNSLYQYIYRLKYKIFILVVIQMSLLWLLLSWMVLGFLKSWNLFEMYLYARMDIMLMPYYTLWAPSWICCQSHDRCPCSTCTLYYSVFTSFNAAPVTKLL